MKIVKIFSKTCGPCKVLEKNLQLSKIPYESIDIETSEGEEYADKYNVRALPTLLLLDGDELKDSVTGVINVEAIKYFARDLNNNYETD